MSTALDIVRDLPMEPCRPVPRYVLTPDQWAAVMQPDVRLLGAWADPAMVHALYDDPDSEGPLFVSLPVENGAYPAWSPRLPAGALYERMIRDLWGHTATGGDARPWLDHDQWPQTRPLAAHPGPRRHPPEPPVFQEIPGEALMQWPIGPLARGIGEAAHLRLTLDGDRIVGAESRLGYTHKGTLGLMLGKSPRVAARFAARLAGDSTVAHSIAFATAAEAALAVAAPPRAAGLRLVMAGLERIATALDDLATLADLTGAARLHGVFGLHQERLRRALAATFGHRLMMDGVVPGGIAGDADPAGLALLRQTLGRLRAEWPDVRRHWDASPMAARLTGLGLAYPTGDAAARARVRLAAIARDIAAVEAQLTDLPEGPMTTLLPMTSGEGLGQAESPRGTIWHWLRLDHGQIVAAFPRDPGWSLWPRAEQALIGAAAADAALICQSFGLPASAMDL